MRRAPCSQGLCFDGGFLYESTGLFGGRSTVRKVDVETGEVLQSVRLGDKYFGEGMVILQDQVGDVIGTEGSARIVVPDPPLPAWYVGLTSGLDWVLLRSVGTSVGFRQGERFCFYSVSFFVHGGGKTSFDHEEFFFVFFVWGRKWTHVGVLLFFYFSFGGSNMVRVGDQRLKQANENRNDGLEHLIPACAVCSTVCLGGDSHVEQHGSYGV